MVNHLHEFCVWRTVSSQSSHHPQEVLLAQFSLYVQKGGIKPDSFHFLHKQFTSTNRFSVPLYQIYYTNTTNAKPVDKWLIDYTFWEWFDQ